MAVQSVLFDRRLFNESQAREWLTKHGYCQYKIDIKPEHLRFRQYDPDDKREYYRTQRLPNGVELIIGYKK